MLGWMIGVVLNIVLFVWACVYVSIGEHLWLGIGLFGASLLLTLFLSQVVPRDNWPGRRWP